MLVKAYSSAVSGIEAVLVGIEANVSPGVRFFLVGLPDSAVRESQQRIESAFRSMDLRWPGKQVVINMAPADIKKEGSSFDLPLAVAVLAANEQVVRHDLEKCMMVGELSLDGTLKPVKGVLSVAMCAREAGLKSIVVPEGNAAEAAVVGGIDVYGLKNLREVVDHFNGMIRSEPVSIDLKRLFRETANRYPFDFSEVKGQESVKRALEVSAAGGHNVIMVGSPGSGKTMLARRVPSIVPPLTLEEALETTRIHSVAGRINGDTALMTTRPFRSPHHTSSSVAMVGGGPVPQPGEISLAHNGILFLDELPEFQRNVLEVMRQPLEDRTVTIARARVSVDYPASFMLIASMNPCPCGFYNHPGRECLCAPGMVYKYLNRISGPLLDRIDIHIEVVPVPFNDLADRKEAESSATIRERVVAARDRQTARFRGHEGIYCNAQMTPSLIRKYSIPGEAGGKLLKNAIERLGLSARAYDRILKVSRTIADLEGSADIGPGHISEAIGYRNLDREGWAG